MKGTKNENNRWGKKNTRKELRRKGKGEGEKRKA
jgi:hypothetical protein